MSRSFIVFSTYGPFSLLHETGTAVAYRLRAEVHHLTRRAQCQTTKSSPAVAVTSVVLAVWHRRSLSGRYEVPVALKPTDRVLFAIASAACLLLVPALLLGVPVAASAAALLVAVGCSWRRPSALRWRLVPWRLVLLVEGLFLVVEAA